LTRRRRFSLAWLVPLLMVGGLLALASLFVQGVLMIAGGVILLALVGVVVFFFGMQ
jgi:hypothetical protein